jgi:hypothetical protein
MILLFNGNLVLPQRKIQFHQFLTCYNSLRLTHNPISYLSQNNWPEFHNTWLLGFTEAEGCFTISFLSNSIAFRTRFILTQKYDMNLPVLSKCISLFGGGHIEGHSAKEVYSYIVSGMKNIEIIYPYFDKYLNSFMGMKLSSYLKFKNLNNLIKEKVHLNKREELRKMSNEINSYSRKIK